MSNKEIEATIRRAFEVDRLLPPVFHNKTRGTLGFVQIPDNLRSLDDLAEDPKFDSVTKEDLKIWEEVLFVWLPMLPPFEREIVKCRCRNMGWKRLARHLVKRKIADRELYRTTLWRSFQEGLTEINRKFG